jgi:NitT/TauT family transport system substrate-binding protein
MRLNGQVGGAGQYRVRPQRPDHIIGVADMDVHCRDLIVHRHAFDKDRRAAEGPLETTTVRLGKGSLCGAPAYLAEELLRAEGFTDVGYPEMPPSTADTAHAVGRGYVDITQGYASQFIPAIEAGEPVTLLAGIHVGCIEMFANEGIRGVADLKGKSVGVQALGSNPHVLLTLMAAQLGLEPVRDLHWVTDPKVKPIERFVDGKIDAFLGFAPEPQELRARHIGHSILNTALDRSWSQYFCCMLGGNREYVRRNPVATKRVIRAYLKAADLCATEPTGAAQQLVEGGYTPRYDYALQALRDIPYDKWREYDPCECYWQAARRSAQCRCAAQTGPDCMTTTR